MSKKLLTLNIIVVLIFSFLLSSNFLFCQPEIIKTEKNIDKKEIKPNQPDNPQDNKSLFSEYEVINTENYKGLNGKLYKVEHCENSETKDKITKC